MRNRFINRFLTVLGGLLATSYSLPVQAQQAYDAGRPTDWFSGLELPFLLLAVFFAFRTATALKGGAFGKGMLLLAWGFAVMAIGHLLMQAKMMLNMDVLAMVLGESFGAAVWIVALVITWGLSWLGFQSIYIASKG